MLGERAYTVQRRGAYTVVDGRMTPGATTTLQIRASIQPVSGRIRETLPEGIRQQVTMVAYTRSVLRGLDHLTDLPPDRIEYRGELLEVADVMPWHEAPLAHHLVALVRAQEDGGRP